MEPTTRIIHVGTRETESGEVEYEVARGIWFKEAEAGEYNRVRAADNYRLSWCEWKEKEIHRRLDSLKTQWLSHATASYDTHLKEYADGRAIGKYHGKDTRLALLIRGGKEHIAHIKALRTVRPFEEWVMGVSMKELFNKELAIDKVWDIIRMAYSEPLAK